MWVLKGPIWSQKEIFGDKTLFQFALRYFWILGKYLFIKIWVLTELQVLPRLYVIVLYASWAQIKVLEIRGVTKGGGAGCTRAYTLGF